MCSGAVVKTLKYSKLVRVCDRGVLRYKQNSQIDKNSPMRIGGQASTEGIDILKLVEEMVSC